MTTSVTSLPSLRRFTPENATIDPRVGREHISDLKKMLGERPTINDMIKNSEMGKTKYRFMPKFMMELVINSPLSSDALRTKFGDKLEEKIALSRVGESAATPNAIAGSRKVDIHDLAALSERHKRKTNAALQSADKAYVKSYAGTKRADIFNTAATQSKDGTSTARSESIRVFGATSAQPARASSGTFAAPAKMFTTASRYQRQFANIEKDHAKLQKKGIEYAIDNCAYGIKNTEAAIRMYAVAQQHNEEFKRYTEAAYLHLKNNISSNLTDADKSETLNNLLANIAISGESEVNIDSKIKNLNETLGLQKEDLATKKIELAALIHPRQSNGTAPAAVPPVAASDPTAAAPAAVQDPTTAVPAAPAPDPTVAAPAVPAPDPTAAAPAAPAPAPAPDPTVAAPAVLAPDPTAAAPAVPTPGPTAATPAVPAPDPTAAAPAAPAPAPAPDPTVAAPAVLAPDPTAAAPAVPTPGPTAATPAAAALAGDAETAQHLHGENVAQNRQTQEGTDAKLAKYLQNHGQTKRSEAGSAFAEEQFKFRDNSGGGDCLFHSLEGSKTKPDLTPIEIQKIRLDVSNVLKDMPGSDKQSRINAREYNLLLQQRGSSANERRESLSNAEFAAIQNTPGTYAGDLEIAQWLQLPRNQGKTVVVLDNMPGAESIVTFRYKSRVAQELKDLGSTQADVKRRIQDAIDESLKREKNSDPASPPTHLTIYRSAAHFKRVINIVPEASRSLASGDGQQSQAPAALAVEASLDSGSSATSDVPQATRYPSELTVIPAKSNRSSPQKEAPERQPVARRSFAALISSFLFGR